MFIAHMPTASGARNAGCLGERNEPLFSNIFKSQTLWGDLSIVATPLINELIARGVYTPEIMQHIVAAQGSVQGIDAVPDDVKAVYKTIAEVKLSTQIQYAADVGPYIDQAASHNIFIPANRGGLSETQVLLKALIMSHKLGLKTGAYYTTIPKPAMSTIQFTVAPSPPALCAPRVKKKKKKNAKRVRFNSSFGSQPPNPWRTNARCPSPRGRDAPRRAP